MGLLKTLTLLSILGSSLGQDAEFFSCPSVAQVPGFTYRDLSALQVAVLYNSTEDLDTFLRSGCDLNYAGAHRSEIRTDCVSPVFRQLGIPCREEVVYSGYTALNLATLHSDQATVARLVAEAGVDLEAASNYTSSPLFNAASRGDLAMVRLLVQAGARLEARAGRDGAQLTPLIAATASGEPAVVEFLLSRGAELEAADDQGYTAAGVAASLGSSEMLQLLGEAGADLSRLQGRGEDAVSLAGLAASRQEGESVELLQHLVTRKVGVDQETALGNTPLFIAALNGNTAAAAVLLGAGADLDHRNKAGATPLLAAVFKGHTATALLLITHGAGVNFRTEEGKDAAFFATLNRDLETLRALVGAGADLNQQSGSVQWSPIMLAAYQGDNEIVSYLMSLGVDLELQDRDGDTALDLAELQYHTDTSNILREK